jgi:predicted glycosyl hydrolase (DUF1957 family)
VSASDIIENEELTIELAEPTGLYQPECGYLPTIPIKLRRTGPLFSPTGCPGKPGNNLDQCP